MFRDFFRRSRPRQEERGASAPESRAPHRLPPGLRVYAIGDIHGRADLLTKMEARIAAHLAAAPPAGRTLAIFLGDYIDRGPASREVIDHLMAGHFAGVPARYLRGNHEEAMLRFLSDPLEGAEWLNWGGMATLASYGVPARDRSKAALIATQHQLAAQVPTAHLEFLTQLELAIELDGYLFVHAGIRPGAALLDQRREDLLEIREPFMSHAERLPWRVVHGHTVLPQAMLGPSRISLDTGAYATGRLSCAVIEGDEAMLLAP